MSPLYRRLFSFCLALALGLLPGAQAAAAPGGRILPERGRAALRRLAPMRPEALPGAGSAGSLARSRSTRSARFFGMAAAPAASFAGPPPGPDVSRSPARPSADPLLSANQDSPLSLESSDPVWPQPRLSELADPVAVASASSPDPQQEARRVQRTPEDFDGAVSGRHLGLVAGKLAAARHGLRKFQKDFRKMARVSPEGRPLLGDAAQPLAIARRWLTIDAIVGLANYFFIGPLMRLVESSVIAGLNGNKLMMALLSAAILGGSLFYGFIEFTHSRWSRVAILRVARNSRIATDGSLLRQELDFHREQGSTRLASRLLSDANIISSLVTNPYVAVPHYVLMFGVGFAAMLVTGSWFALPAALILPALGVLSAAIGEKLGELSQKLLDMRAEMLSRAQESLQHADEVKSFDSLPRELEYYSRFVDKAAEYERRAVKLFARYTLFADGFSDLFLRQGIYILGIAALGTSFGLPFSALYWFALFAGTVRYAAMGGTGVYLEFRRDDLGARKAFELMNREPKIKDRPGAATLPPGPGAVRFENVRFRYPLRPEVSVLKGLSFEAKPGQTVAFVGPSGSGKSTLTSLLLRLHEPYEGRIEVDGTEIRDVTIDSLLSRVAVVQQNARLFSTTIRDNVLYGVDGVSEERLSEALVLAQAGFVLDEKRFPKGLDTQVGEGGARLSGGELQRLVIARALLMNPSILIRDEATAALDNESEQLVESALNEVRGPDGRKPTTLLIAHRLSTIRRADVINVIDQGEIVETGTHEELIARGGVYARVAAEMEDASEAEPEAARQAQAARAAPATADAGEALRLGRRERLKAWASDLRRAARDSVSAWEPQLRELSRPKRAFLRGYLSARFALGRAAADARAFARQRARSLAARIAAAASSVWKQLREFVTGDPELRRFVPWRVVAWLAVLFAAESLARVYGTQVLGGLMDAASKGVAVALWPAAPLSIALGGVAVALHFYASKRMGELAADASAEVRKGLFARLHKRSMRFLAGNDSTELASRLNEDVGPLMEKNLSFRAAALGHALTLVASVGFLLAANLYVGGLVLGVLGIVSWLNGKFGHKSQELRRAFAKARAALGRYGREALDLIDTVKVFRRVHYELERYAKAAQDLVEIGEKEAPLNAKAHALSSSLTEFAKQLILIIGLWTIAGGGALTIGALVTMTFYAGFIRSSSTELWKIYLGFRGARGEVGVVRDILADPVPAQRLEAEEPLSDSQSGHVSRLDAQVKALTRALQARRAGSSAALGAIEFTNVSFRYEEDGSGAAIEDFTLSVKSGQTVALVGLSGSGKSTLLKLLQGLHPLSGGSIAVDGVTAAELGGPEGMAGILAKVSQKPRLFDESARYNINYGRPDASDAEIHAAIVAAQAEFLYTLPEGLNTRVGEGGANLSGGQRQRIAIARALLMNPSVLLLDEGTSDLDKETEDDIQATVSALPMTRLIIAHNLHTITNADTIVVMDEGRIAETGTHAELLARGGIYARLWKKQHRGR